MAKKKSVKNILREKMMFFYIALFVLVSLYVGTFFYNSVIYENKIYPGVKISGLDIGGKTKEEAKEIIAKKLETVKEDIILTGQKDYVIEKKDLVLSYEIDKTVDRAFEVGRDDDLNPTKKYREDIPLEVTLNTDVLTGNLIEITRLENEPVQDASIYISKGKLKTNKETVGNRVFFGENFENIRSGISRFENKFKISSRVMEPTVTEADITFAEDQIEEVLKRKVALIYGQSNYGLREQDLANFILLQKGKSKNSVIFSSYIEKVFPYPQTGNNLNIAFDRENIRDWCVGFADNINRSPKNARLQGSGGKVVVAAESVDGRKVKIDELSQKIKDALDNKENKVEIPVEVTEPEVSSDNLGKLGLKEIVSTGWTDFSGSPINRRHNINTGASKFNGVLIKPGEKFSFNETLGPVEASTGYLPELVIKKDKTVPEYGGGLCQVSSTAFRAALNAGLPIISRSAHAYPVVYYKPFGVDATIYLPSPDLIFENDTSGYILIQTHINGNKLYFDFYGTKKPVSIKFAGDENATVGVSDLVEGITPVLTEQESRGKGSFTAQFYRFLYDSSGKMVKKNYWISRYDSPDKYPH